MPKSILKSRTPSVQLFVCPSVCPFVRNCLSVCSCPNSISSHVFGLNTKICIPRCFQWCVECHKNIFGYMKPLWEKLQKEESKWTDKQMWTNGQTKMSFRTSISYVEFRQTTHLSICLSVHLSFCWKMFKHLSICLSVHLSVCWKMSEHLSIGLSICLFAEKCPNIYLVCLSKHVSMYGRKLELAFTISTLDLPEGQAKAGVAGQFVSI